MNDAEKHYIKAKRSAAANRCNSEVSIRAAMRDEDLACLIDSTGQVSDEVKLRNVWLVYDHELEGV
jgi:hypothetical protein